MNSMKNLTIQETAKLCKVAEITVRNWIKNGVLNNAFKVTITGRKRWLIPYTDIPAFYRKNVQTNNQK